jgi:peptidoglycan hydrolase-like protein with peptidoglycan-binding domain
LRKLTSFFLIGTILLLSAIAGAQETAKKKTAKKPHASSSGSKHRRGKKTSWKRKGQQGIAPERAREIQEALIRQNYLTGEPSGIWDARTQAAMTKYQADNGWQTKVIPDSRALIKLGLGPNYSENQLLNAPARSSDGVTTASAVGAGATSSSAATHDKQ